MKKNNIADRLKRFDSHINPNGKSSASKKKLPERYHNMADRLGGTLIDRPAGQYCLVRRHFNLDYKHGSLKLGDFFDTADLPMAAFQVRPSDESVPTQSLLFFDTETTGLGGAGAVPFLIGCGSLTPDGLEVRQYIIPDYSDEAAMLEDILEEFSNDRTVVSYNGAAFDIPIVRDRMIINRVDRHLDPNRHIDLLHSARRLYKRRIADCSLTNVERQLMDFHRVDDIPGYLVPSIYFEWLSSEDLSQMEGVLEHNRLDIVSLFFLAIQVSRAYDSLGASMNEIDDLHSLSKFYGRQKSLDRATKVCRRIEREKSGELSDDIIWHQSLLYKRTGELGQAVPLWKNLATKEGREAFLAGIELAKYSEHKLRDFSAALDYAQKAMKFKGITPVRQRQIQKRVKRLSDRLSR